MANSQSDRNLLIGVLALQFGLVTRDQLVDAISAWGSDKSQTLDDIFVRQNVLSNEHRQRLLELVTLHVQLHGGDVEKSLAALSSVSDVRNDLQTVKDPEVGQSLRRLACSFIEVGDSQPSSLRTMPYSDASGLRFRILRPHAKSGLGEVSVALDSELNREVALKEIQRQHVYEPDSRSRFLLEAHSAARLSQCANCRIAVFWFTVNWRIDSGEIVRLQCLGLRSRRP